MTARIAPAGPPFAPDIKDAFDRIMPPGVPPLTLFTTVARNPRVFARMMAGGLLDKGSITLRDREIMIDRTCARCGSEYEWGVHVIMFGEKAGLTAEQVEATVLGEAGDPVWSERDRLILRTADELHETSSIGDGLWRELRGAFDETQILELIAVAGFYHMISYFTNALRIPPESYAARFPSKAQPNKAAR